MKDVFIINAGGFGRNMASVAHSDSAHGRLSVVRSFLDARKDSLQIPGATVFGNPAQSVSFR